MFSKISDRDSFGYMNKYRSVIDTGINQIDRVMLLHLDTDFSDSSPVGITMTVSGTSISTAQKKFGIGSALTTATNQYMRPPSTSDYQIGKNNSDYTLDFWIRPTSISSGSGQIIMGFPSFSGHLYVKMNTDGSINWGRFGDILATTASSLLAIDTWAHVAIEKEATDNRLYVDGVLVSTQTILLTDNSTWQFGHVTPSETISAYWDEIAMVRKAKYKGNNFTPPTAPYLGN